MKKIYFLVLALCLFTGVKAQIINFPDANLKSKLMMSGTGNLIAVNFSDAGFKIDVNNDGEIEVAEALLVKKLSIGGDSAGTPSLIANLTGIENFTNLQELYCSYSPAFTGFNFNSLTALKKLSCTNTAMAALDVSALVNLQTLNCSNNPSLASLNVNGLINLTSLSTSNCLLTSLDVSSLVSLTHLSCFSNQLTSLNPSNLSNLNYLGCFNNQLTTLNTMGLGNLSSIDCRNNLLAALDLSQVSTIAGYLYLNCSDNRLTTLDLSSIRKINQLNCQNNPFLESLILKNGTLPDDTVVFSNCPNLHYVCQDEYYVYQIQSLINQYGYTNCTANSYCSMEPGGVFYTVQGTSRVDTQNNGCDASDFQFPYLRFTITGGVDAGSFIVNASGNYAIPLHDGSHNITPYLENPGYFFVAPPSVNVNFPIQASPFTQNFCITANGVHPDLEVSILPINAARPGFDAIYKFVYKNKGNTTQSGTVNVVFNDAVLDFVSANPVVTTQTVNNLTWNFTNLLPFETREITFTLNVNSPMETPAVNNGDVLNYTATITSAATDDMPNDNTFVFNQMVVNSYDPNDKTCLEGATIPPSKVGDYVHYMIRFENNGTANAQNIVVKDMIDTNKFDINSLVPIKGSHSFVTNISAGNKVELIFENINLPFDDANNDGYVSFKIKTKPTLTNGDTFSNSASIYFDYNFPIVTNTATTTIQALSRQDFEFSNYFKLFPNPVSSTLNIETKDSIQISSINIYNTLGQLVLVVPNAQNLKMVDVSNLSSGNYFIKINSDKGTSNTKFIKQ
ncbi:DUF7619 domain-containing protein [Flavobacterium terrae]|uniref:Conserved repeat domain-containing protein/Por secretion system C-terminal sorting domain-containing protein n=1 Tax=Flavobacterium terrae TaxID=415425 RepID=A0A1M6GZE9_9FLAO|nr:T9SS type A sorting domain-containing protein [Flavobacterium terrae]SHJ15349.1 conserved repeat domain-containing protein/Por secretion system C-terminal sorting domain-containing protein [Flavobacterium terrae]